jgi:UDPglucose--hexose-1-phosphate uridylyltransferase
VIFGVPSSSQRIAYNPALGEPVVQTPGRMSRGEHAAECPFCAAIAAGQWPEGETTWMRPNDFPPLSPPVGECFVLLYARAHGPSFAQLGHEQARDVISLWRRAYEELSARYPCVMTFENAGAAIGQTQAHPHGQTYAVSFLPPTIARELAQVEAFHAGGKGCLFCDVLSRECRAQRVVIETAQWIGFVPEYARYPYEVHLYPRVHVANLGGLAAEGAAIAELAAALHAVIRAYDRVFEGPMPYMLAIHQLATSRFHLHLELLPAGRAPGTLKYAASSETAFGLWLNDALPEQKAAELRAAIAAGGGTRGD